jgi:hypothetical protein
MTIERFIEEWIKKIDSISMNSITLETKVIKEKKTTTTEILD